MEAVEMKDMKVGWWGLFDAMYGPEKVLAISHYKLTDRVEDNSARIGYGVEVQHMQVTDERGESPVGRFITRAIHEPVMAMTFPDLPVEIAEVEVHVG